MFDPIKQLNLKYQIPEMLLYYNKYTFIENLTHLMEEWQFRFVKVLNGNQVFHNKLLFNKL